VLYTAPFVSVNDKGVWVKFLFAFSRGSFQRGGRDGRNQACRLSLAPAATHIVGDRIATRQFIHNDEGLAPLTSLPLLQLLHCEGTTELNERKHHTMKALLLQLPPEVLLEIIELLYEDYCVTSVESDTDGTIDISWLFTEHEEWRRNPLEALRLYVCFLLDGPSIL